LDDTFLAQETTSGIIKSVRTILSFSHQQPQARLLCSGFAMIHLMFSLERYVQSITNILVSFILTNHSKNCSSITSLDPMGRSLPL